MPDCDAANRCPYQERISKMEARLESKDGTMGRVEQKLDTLLTQVGKIELLEHKHATQSDTINRAFESLAEVRQQSIDTARGLADLLSQIRGMARSAYILWSLMGAAVVASLWRSFLGVG